MQNLYTNSSLDFIDNPIDLYWKNQPSYPNSKAFIHETKFSGESALIKIKKIQEKLILKSLDYYLLTSLDSIAWLLNIRGNDIANTPLVHSYVIIPQKGKIELFLNSKTNHLRDYFECIVNINKIDTIDFFINNIDIKKNIGMDEVSTSYYFKYICIKRGILTNNFKDPCIYPKAIKNEIELAGARKANIRDGISLCKFLYWLKNQKDPSNIDEIKASEYLLNLRRNNDLFYTLSFSTISAFGHHAALPHYSVNKNSNLTFKNNSIYLVDSGVQYKDGTTDITRTIIFGNATNEQKDRFTRVLKGHIAIALVTFTIGTKGSQIDFLARKSLKEVNCDYDHGTGHGIGSFSNVHEGPQKIAKSQEQSDGIIKEGMILSNEPGYYKEKEYGIRTENLVVCRLSKSNLLYFETISWAPIDRDLIDIKLLNDDEILWINKYHKKVYEKIGSNLEKKEQKWLYDVTLPLTK